jgi:hypothetical protein
LYKQQDFSTWKNCFYTALESGLIYVITRSNVRRNTKEFSMKNKILLVMLAIALVFGMTLAGCKDKDDGGGEATLEGTWVNNGASMGGSDMTLTFTGSDFEYTDVGGSWGDNSLDGTFTSTATEITFSGDFGTFTKTYSFLSGGKKLKLEEGGYMGYGTFTKQ